jgi:hypothetical protein
MRNLRRCAAVVVLVAVIGCRGDAHYVAPESPMPANTILLSQMMRELSEKPGFTDTLLAQLNRDGRQGPALLTPALFDRLRQLILGKDWQELNRFPGWTMAAITPTVRVVGKVVATGDNKNPIPPAGAPTGNPPSTPPMGGLADHIDLGPFALNRAETVSLDQPSTLAGFATERAITEIGAGVTRGDGPNPALAPLHAESERLAYVLNRLSLNGLGDTATATAKISGEKGGHSATTPQALISALAETGHTVVVSDARYFANFGHFHFNGQEVMMPFWIDSQIRVPGTRRSLLVPVSHAEYQWHIRGPKINADVSFYFGIDGKAQFRTMDTLDQAWVLGRHAHEYRDADALEVTRLVGLIVVAYAHQHIRRPDLPFGGYFTLGVCQDSVAAIEKKMTGRATLFPNTADAALFDDPRDGEINALIHAIPKDRNGVAPEPERVFGSLPTYDFNAITIPGLGNDLNTVNDAWQWGELNRTHTWIRRLIYWFAIAAVLLALWRFIARRPERSPHIHVHRTK